MTNLKTADGLDFINVSLKFMANLASRNMQGLHKNTNTAMKLLQASNELSPKKHIQFATMTTLSRQKK
jgi:hypothetical protein